jgi:transcriptional regulator with XRE-family HTH domain
MEAGIGERLREARDDLGLELEEITERTKIRVRYLQAMEEERWEALPGAAYARSFLHTYAEELGLDADALVDEYRRAEPARDRPEPDVPPAAPITPAPGDAPRGRGRGPASRRWVPIAGVLLAGVLAIVAVIGLAGGSDDDDGESAEGPRPAGQQGGGGGGASKQQAPAPEPSPATLRLTTTGTVWVCVVNRAGEALVEGVTLPAGEEQGPFRAGGFDIALGNGQVEIEANGEPVPIPAAAEPVGFRVTREATRELDAAERPTCT